MCMLCSIDIGTVNMIAPIAQATIISAPILLRGHIRRGAQQILSRRAGEASGADETGARNDATVAPEADPMETPSD